MSPKYIMFNQHQKGCDGSKYIKNVKYKLSMETPEAFYIASKDKMNVFKKSALDSGFVTGSIVQY